MFAPCFVVKRGGETGFRLLIFNLKTKILFKKNKLYKQYIIIHTIIKINEK